MSVIDEYTAGLRSADQAVLLHIRDIIVTSYPDAVETISYAMPVCKLRGKYLIGFSVFKDHYSLFPGSGPITDLKRELSAFKTATGTIRFTDERPMPDELLKRILDACAARIP